MFVEERRKEDGTKVERDDRCINHSAEMDKGLRLKPGYAEQLARDLGEYNKVCSAVHGIIHATP